MKNLLFFILTLSLFSCQKNDERCGQIIQKIERENSFYFVLQTDEYINYYNTPDSPTIPEYGVKQGIVSKENYNSFSVGDEYCSAI